VIGTIILTTYDRQPELTNSVEILIPASIIIAAGVFLFIVGLLGCVGGMRGNKCCLTLVGETNSIYTPSHNPNADLSP